MPYAPPSAHERSVVDTLQRVFDAGQQLLLDRLELMRFDVTETTSRTIRGVFLIAAGIMLLAGAAAMSLAVVVTLLARVMSQPAAIMVVGGVVAALGAVALIIGMQRTHLNAERSMTEDLLGDDRGEGESRQ